MDAHHVGQKALMKKMIPEYNEKTATAILVPSEGHTSKNDDNQIISRSAKGLKIPRQVLWRDIKELRRVYPDIPNRNLQELVKNNKELYSKYFLTSSPP